MANRVYTLSGDNQTVVAAPQLCWLNPAASGAAASGFSVIRAWCSQRANATSAQQGIRLGTKVSVFPTMVGATPALTQLGDSASKLASGTGAAGTAGINSSANGAGTEIGIYPDNFNVLNGWLWVPTPNEIVTLMPGGTSGFFAQFLNTPTTLTGWSFGLAFAEIG